MGKRAILSLVLACGLACGLAGCKAPEPSRVERLSQVPGVVDRLQVIADDPTVSDASRAEASQTIRHIHHVRPVFIDPAK